MRATLLAAVLSATVAGPSLAATEGPHMPAQTWLFQGMFGTFDRGALGRGFQVYREVCATCHSMSLLFYRNLAGIGLNEDQIKQIAAAVQVVDGPNEQGEMVERPGRPTDRFKAPFANAQAARAANNGALPPDLSLITKAREGGADYLHAVLTGYREQPPEGVTMSEGMAYNQFFAGNQIAMPPPLSEGQVQYPDGTPATVAQMATDVTTFLAWAAEPETEERKRMGIKVLLFLFVLTGMLYAVKRRVWANVAH